MKKDEQGKQHPSRMEQDVKHTSRTMQPGKLKDSGTASQSSNTAGHAKTSKQHPEPNDRDKA